MQVFDGSIDRDIALNMQEISKSFPGVVAADNVHFSVYRVELDVLF